MTSVGLDDYITTVVGNYLDDRSDGESFAAWADRADEMLLRGEKALSGGAVGMSARAVPFHCPYCGDENLWPHEPDEGSPDTASGNAGRACGRSSSA